MTEKSANTRGRPITNQVDQIPDLPENIAKALFRAADKKMKPVKKKPN
ncbi:MAG: hypothetical protein M3Y27_18390 [Acidobacteriota bacterium]|nr:hypothetical protein [Acidobacteriota bacterium]